MIVFFLAANAFNLFTRFLPLAFYITLAMAIFSGLHYVWHANRLMNEQEQKDSGERSE